MSKLLLVTTAVVAAAGVAAIAVVGPADAAPAPAASHSKYVIEIKNFGFKGDLKVKPGAKVKVKNEDSVTHTLTSDKAGKFNTGKIKSDHTDTFRAPTKPGHYAFHCKIHSDMTATLIVKKHT